MQEHLALAMLGFAFQNCNKAESKLMLHSLLQRNASRIQIPTATVTSNSSSED
jgi:hypothetical protein